MFNWFKKKEPTLSPIVQSILDSWENTPERWTVYSQSDLIKSKCLDTWVGFTRDYCFVYNPNHNCTKYEDTVLRRKYIEMIGGML